MELVEGESLEELIVRAGRVPVRDALRIARQIADALEAAHERGIVHRDLKPANVRVNAGKGTIDIPASFSPDGAWLLFDRVVAGKSTLLALSLRDRRIAPFGGVSSTQRTGAVFSPDGKWVAYATREPGRPNALFIEPFPATGAKYLISSSTEDAHHPVWSPDGKELFHTPGPGNRAIRVPVTFMPSPAFGSAVLFERAFSNLAASSDRAYHMMADGRFLSITDLLLTESGLTSMTIVLNWYEELKAERRSGADRRFYRGLFQSSTTESGGDQAHRRITACRTQPTSSARRRCRSAARRSADIGRSGCGCRPP
jgi:serine/threonine protein kinase